MSVIPLAFFPFLLLSFLRFAVYYYCTIYGLAVGVCTYT